jgi:hypothetical protein
MGSLAIGYYNKPYVALNAWNIGEDVVAIVILEMEQVYFAEFPGIT